MQSEWDTISETFSEVKDHQDSVFPHIRNKLYSLRPHRLLDYGCGNGDFAHVCSSLPIQEIVFFDMSPNMLALAREKCAPFSHMRAEENTHHLPENHFDIITFNAVWMCIASHQDCVQTLKEIHRLLKTDGHFFAAVTHPCFRNFDYAVFRTDFSIKDYSKEGTPFNVQMSKNDSAIQFTDYHWTIGAMSRQLKEAGFLIEEISELPEKDAQGELKPGIPWMIISARKS